MITPRERDVLRRLAAQVRQAADHPVMAERKRLWKLHNALTPQRPMVLCFPEGCWPELLAGQTFECEDPQARDIEGTLRSKLYWWQHLNDDNTLEPFFDVNWRIDWDDFGVNIPRVQGDNRGSYHWDPPLKDLDRDFALLKHRHPKLDRHASECDLELVNELLGDILPARRRARLWWTQGLTRDAAFFLGIEPLMLTMYDNPEGLHRLMAFLRDDQLNIIEWAQREKLLTGMNQNDYTGSGGMAYTDELPDAAGTLRDLWGFAESQETVGISPDHFAEFVLPYQLPLLEKFGLNCYGCCEQLETRIGDVLKQVPRLRRISVAPLANQEKLAAAIDGRYIFSRKPDPTKVCVGFNEEGIRMELRHTLALAGRGPLEIIMKDTHTVQNEPWRLTRWVEIAREEIERFMGPEP